MEGSHILFQYSRPHKNAVKKNCALLYYFYMWQIKMAMISCSVTAEMLGIVLLFFLLYAEL